MISRGEIGILENIPMTRAMRTILVFLVRTYQAYLRPHLIGCCKFHPTCSEYCIESLQTHGVVRGTWFSIKRVFRCHPLTRGGIDLVPPRVGRVEHSE